MKSVLTRLRAYVDAAHFSVISYVHYAHVPTIHQGSDL